MDRLVEAHQKAYGCKPDVIGTAPGRIHLIGEHTWFFKDKTLSMGVNLPVYISVSSRDDSNLQFFFAQMDDIKKSSLSALKFKKEDKWANAIKCVLHGFISGGFNLKGMNFTVYSDVLPSSGFGITTAIKVAAAWTIKELCGLKCSHEQLMQVIERGNKLFLGIENHKADNIAAIYSKENSVVLTDYSLNSYELLPFKFKNKSILLVDAKVPRIVTWNEESLLQPENVLLLGELKNPKPQVPGGWVYEEKRAEVNDVLGIVQEQDKKRLLCIMQEHKCIQEAYTALKENDFSAFARAVNKSYDGMSNLYDISCPEIDWILKRLHSISENTDFLRNPTACGRITGKGFARGIYAVLNTEDIDNFKEQLVEYDHIFGFKPEVYEIKPAKGVHLL